MLKPPFIKKHPERNPCINKCGNLCALLTLRNSNNTDVFPPQNYLTMFQCHSVNVEIIRICVFEWDHCRNRTVNNVKYYLCLLYSTYSFHYSHLHQPKLEKKNIENIHILETLAQVYLLSPKDRTVMLHILP